MRNNSTLAQSILEEIGNEGQIMRKYYQRRLPEDPSKDYYYIIRETSPLQSLLVEYGFIDNANDRVKLQNNLLDYVEAVVRAIAEYANVPYTGPGGSGGFYTVVKGDSLWSIANKFGVTVQELRDVNNLKSDVLSIGQILKIPGSGSNFITYTVVKGDTLFSIASRYGVSVNDLRKANNLTSDVLSIGQVLTIPTNNEDDGDDEDIIIPPLGPTTTYTVVKGDSLWSIANKFGVTVQELRAANNLVTDVLSVGQVLVIPNGDNVEDNETATYTVVSGDSLWSIANKFGTTVDAIKNLNNLTSNLLSVGQVLLIPSSSSNNYIIYKVVSGDSLWSIANRFGTTVDAIKNLNNLTSNLLSVGQELKIPNI